MPFDPSYRAESHEWDMDDRDDTDKRNNIKWSARPVVRPLFQRQSSSNSTVPLLFRRDSSQDRYSLSQQHHPHSSPNEATSAQVELQDPSGGEGCHIEPAGASTASSSTHVHPFARRPSLSSPSPTFAAPFTNLARRLKRHLGRLRRDTPSNRSRQRPDGPLEGGQLESGEKLYLSIHRDLHTATQEPHGRSRRRRRSCFMIGTVVAVVLLFYAWNVEVLWGGERMRGKHHEFGSPNASNASSIMRQMVHSHNDEMHGADALIWALSLGVGSIEADTWLKPTTAYAKSASTSISSTMVTRRRGLSRLRWSSSPNTQGDQTDRKTTGDTIARNSASITAPETGMTLFTGHKVKDLTDATLDGFYLAPLLARLDENNRGRRANESIVGLYKDDPTSEVQFVIDMKSDGDSMWPYVVAALQPFLDKGYLTTYDTTTRQWARSAIMVIGTGNTPVHRVYYQSTRSVFYDAPLKELASKFTLPASDAGPAASIEWDSTFAPIASDKLPVPYHIALALPPWNPIANRLRAYTLEARRRGIASRWWGAASKPAWVRRRMWEIQKQGGVDWINADDLADAVDWLSDWNAR